MPYENIRFRKQNITVVDGYFYMMDEDVDSLIVKTDDGTQAFSYPLSITLEDTADVLSLEYDGRNFWSLQQTDAGTHEVTIRRWYINNYVCKLRDSFVLYDAGSHEYQSQAFTVEHYHKTINTPGGLSSGASAISMDESNVEVNYTLTLGPSTHTNNLNAIEEVTVSGVISVGSVGIYGTTTYDYNQTDPISLYTKIWLFNDYCGTTTSGALYEINAYTGARISHDEGGEYKNIKACTFYDMSDANGDWDNAICYVKATQMIFLNPADLTSNFGAMIMDNVHSNLSTTLDIFDVGIEGTNVYRLQRYATYYETTTDWGAGAFNYQLSTFEPFITSISLSANPAILPANSVSLSDITAIVKDQFDQPITYRTVDFEDDDTYGVITNVSAGTDINGVATTQYRSGTQAREVKITATAQQT